MKKLILILSFVIIPVISHAQDRMIKTDNTILTVKIFEIGEDIIRYKPFDKQEGPMFSINRSTVHKVILESGDEFVYNPLTQIQTTNSNTTVLSNPVESSSPVSTTNPPQTQTDDEERMLNTKNIQPGYTSWLNFDLSNSDNISSNDEDKPSILIMEITTFNFLIPMSGSDLDNDIEGSHGIIIRGSLRASTVNPPTSITVGGSTTSFIADMGIGYGYNYKTDLRAFAALNTTLFFNSSTFSGGDEITINEWFPSDTGSLRLGLLWTPLGKNTRWGPYVAFDSYFAEGAGNAFYIGFSLK